MPAVSVIMPAYNVSAYIGEAIASVRSQTFADFEVLIVDDGSTDDTAAIALRHAREDARVRVLRQANQGISAARNTALRLARGELFALLDSDDVWLPAYLASQVALLERHPDVDIVSGNGIYLGGLFDGRPVGACPDPRPAPGLIDILRDETAIFIMSTFRRRVYDTIGDFDERLRTNEDYDFWLRAAAAGFRFLRNDEPLGRYRRRNDSLSANEVRMIRGVLVVYRGMRAPLAGRAAELAILDAQIRRFETEELAAAARASLESGRAGDAGDALAALHARRGGASLRVAALLARWAPALLTRAYRFRRARQLAAIARGHRLEVT